MVAIISLMAIGFGTFVVIDHASHKIAYVYNCGIIDFKPQSLTPYCADVGAGIANIEWTTWDKDGASGTADYAVNDCDPNCAEGSIDMMEVTFTLSKPVKDGDKIVLSRVDLASTDGTNLPLLDSPNLGWNLERKPLSSVK